MDKRTFCAAVVDHLEENNERKPIAISKHKFFISDTEGNEAEFVINKKNKTVMYTAKDVMRIMDACIAVAEDCLRRGDVLCIRGLGSLYVHRRAKRTVRALGSNEWMEVEEHYVPKITFSNNMRAAAKLFGLSGYSAPDPADFDDSEFGDDEMPEDERLLLDEDGELGDLDEQP